MRNVNRVETLIQDFQSAEGVVEALIAGYDVLLEDRIDDLIARYTDEEGKPTLNRRMIQDWFQYDPTNNKKYMPWIIKEVAEGRMQLPANGHELRDGLMTFERLLPIPAYTGIRDLYQTDWDGLREIVSQFGNLQSKTSQEKQKRMEGVKVVAKHGNLTLLKITDVQSLNNWSWKAYQAENPNWTKKPVLVGSVADPFTDHLWCTRFPTFATTYLQGGPFYLVLKDGGPYVGIVFERGEAQTLDNSGISTAVAEEIWPVVKEVAPKDASGLSRNARVFANLRFLDGTVEPGSTVAGTVDLSGTRLTSLPSNLTINGTLDVSNTPLTELPPGLTVAGTLKINGTQISTLPQDLRVEDMEWSEPLNWTEVKSLLYRLRHMDMKDHYMNHPKLEGKSPEQKEQAWINFQPKLRLYFQTHDDVDKNVRSMYRKV